MITNREKVVVAMSGGVDSSVAACLLAEQGYEVIGLFMRVGSGAESEADSGAEAACVSEMLTSEGGGEESPSTTTASRRAHQGCCSASDARDARYVAGMLGVPFYALNFQRDFEAIIDYFAAEYARGRTPNPCVPCNDQLKFGKVVEYADAVGAKYIATGHYARVERRDGETRLLRGVDAMKDQSYFLFGVDRAILDRVLFPVGHLPKSKVRALAEKYDLPNRAKPDSVEICFVPDRDYARVVKQRRPEAFAGGDIVNTDGERLGSHDGLGHYTIGQRRGLGVSAPNPLYVTQLNVESNTVVVGERDELLSGSLIASRVNMLRDMGDEPFRADVKIRYLHRAAPATVYPLDGDQVRVAFDEPQRAVTPGQATVFYESDTVLGGAWIERGE